LRLSIVEFQNEAPVFEFLAIRGRSYELYGAVELNDWNPIPMQVQGSEESQTVINAQESRVIQIRVGDLEGQDVPRFFKLLAQ
jgi:hypothetical protein